MSRTKKAGWTVQETAELLKRTDRQVRRLCERGALEWTKEGVAYVIDPSSARRYKELRNGTEHGKDTDIADIADIADRHTRETDVPRTSRSDVSDGRPQKADMRRTSSADIGPARSDIQSSSADIDDRTELSRKVGSEVMSLKFRMLS